MRQKRLMIRSKEFDAEGPETRLTRRELRNSVIEKRIRVPPLIEASIRDNGLVRELKLDITDKKASFLIGWYTGIVSPDLITSSEEIDRFLVTRIERSRTDLEKYKGFSRHVFRANIEVMKGSLGLAQDEKGNWLKNPTKITHAVKIPSSFGVSTDHAILTIGTNGLTITPLTEQESWVKMITPKSYNFTVSFSPGESAMIKFGFKW